MRQSCLWRLISGWCRLTPSDKRQLPSQRVESLLLFWAAGKRSIARRGRGKWRAQAAGKCRNQCRKNRQRTRPARFRSIAVSRSPYNHFTTIQSDGKNLSIIFPVLEKYHRRAAARFQQRMGGKSEIGFSRSVCRNVGQPVLLHIGKFFIRKIELSAFIVGLSSAFIEKSI